MTTKQAAQYLGISYYYLRNLRHQELGPPFTFVKHPRGIACHYTVEDLETWAKGWIWRKGHMKETYAERGRGI